MREERSTPAQWFAKAESDLRAAEIVIEREELLSDIACYHAQQCAEKYLKGYLVSRGAPFKRVHELAYLIRLCTGCDKEFRTLTVHAVELQDYASDVRYPMEDDSAPSMDDAREAIRRAKAIRDFVLARIRSAGTEGGETR